MSLRSYLVACMLLAAAACGSRHGQTPSTSVSMDDARRTALARVPGQVIEEELEEENGRWVYEFDIRPSGTVTPDQEVVVDANSGQILEVGED